MKKSESKEQKIKDTKPAKDQEHLSQLKKSINIIIDQNKDNIKTMKLYINNAINSYKESITDAK